MNEKWIEALRSGDYAQGFAYLHNLDTNEYCCLGVLATVAGLEGQPPEDIFPANAMQFDGSSEVLDNGWFMTTTGLSADVQDLLARINDTGGTFAQIADALEAVDPAAAITDLVDDVCGNNH